VSEEVALWPMHKVREEDTNFPLYQIEHELKFYLFITYGDHIKFSLQLLAEAINFMLFKIDKFDGFYSSLCTFLFFV
jgi:hypothetical protein